MSRLALTSIEEEEAVIQYPITPESSLVCTKEEPPCPDSSVTDPEGLVADLMSRTREHPHLCEDSSFGGSRGDGGLRGSSMNKSKKGGNGGMSRSI